MHPYCIFSKDFWNIWSNYKIKLMELNYVSNFIIIGMNVIILTNFSTKIPRKYRYTVCNTWQVSVQKYHVLFIVSKIVPDNWNLGDGYTKFVSIPSKTGFLHKKKFTLSKIWINVLKILKPLDEKNDIRFREKSLNCPEQSHPTITYSGDKNCHLLMTSLLGENILQNCFWTSKYQRHNHQCLCNPSTQTK